MWPAAQNSVYRSRQFAGRLVLRHEAEGPQLERPRHRIHPILSGIHQLGQLRPFLGQYPERLQATRIAQMKIEDDDGKNLARRQQCLCLGEAGDLVEGLY